jgi:hypothetical protein
VVTVKASTGTETPVEASESFTLTIENPCLYFGFVKINAPSIDAIEYEIDTSNP